jgi:hypothetical protein
MPAEHWTVQIFKMFNRTQKGKIRDGRMHINFREELLAGRRGVELGKNKGELQLKHFPPPRKQHTSHQ